MVVCDTRMKVDGVVAIPAHLKTIVPSSHGIADPGVFIIHEEEEEVHLKEQQLHIGPERNFTHDAGSALQRSEHTLPCL